MTSLQKAEILTIDCLFCLLDFATSAMAVGKNKRLTKGGKKGGKKKV